MQIRDVYSIECKSKKEIPDDNFIENSKNFIDDFLLMASLISGYPILWYQYIFISKSKIEENIISKDSEIKEIDAFNELLVEDRDFKTFISSVIPKYFELKNDNINLTIPIRSYLFSESAKFLEQQFILTYVALENICNQLSRKGNIEFCTKGSSFKKFQKEMENLINTFDLNEIEKENMKEKLIEINRNSVKYKFEQIFKQYNIDIRNCYDSNCSIKFLRIRNQLIHSSKHEIDSDLLIDEYHRIRRYFELIVLRILGWEKAINPYNKYNQFE